MHMIGDTNNMQHNLYNIVRQSPHRVTTSGDEGVIGIMCRSLERCCPNFAWFSNKILSIF